MTAFVHHTLVTTTILVARFCQDVQSSVKNVLENAQFKSGALFVYGYERNLSEDKCSSTELHLQTRDRFVTGQFIQKVLISSRNIIYAPVRRMPGVSIQTSAISSSCMILHLCLLFDDNSRNGRLFLFVFLVFEISENSRNR